MKENTSKKGQRKETCCLHVGLLSVLLLPRISRDASSSSSHYHCCSCYRPESQDGVAWVRAALVSSAPPACASVAPCSSSTPMPSSHLSPCHTASPSCVPMPVHNSCALEVSPQPNCEAVTIFLWPANRPFVGCLLRLSAQPVPLLLAGSDGCPAAKMSPRQSFSGFPPREQPLLGLGLLLLLLRLVLVLLGWGVGLGEQRGAGRRSLAVHVCHCPRKCNFSPTPHDPAGST
jgi:hypothetical protein